MSQLPISFEALQTLDAIDRRGSFAKAAEELNKATSALSYTIQKLEEQLGVTLFQRQGRRSVLTPSGKLLLGEGRKILEATHFLADQVRELDSGWEPRLRIALESTTEREPFFEAIKGILAEHPHLEIDIQESVLSGGWEALETDSVDLLVGAPAPVPPQKGFRAIAMSPANMILVVSTEHPLANNQEDVSEKLDNYRRIVVHDTAKQNVLRSEGLTSSSKVLYVQTMDQKIHALLTSLGVSHLPRKLAQPYIDSGQMLEIYVKSATSQNNNRYIAWKISNKGKALKRLVSLLEVALP